MGMRPPVIFAPIFTDNNPRNVLMSFLMIKGLMEGLCAANCAWLRCYPGTPSIYAHGVEVGNSKVHAFFEGVRYEPEAGTENWLTIPYIIAAGKGDCEDLACWRAAELRMKGIGARPDMRARIMPDGVWRAHAIVRLPGGQIEDPSLKLGMKGAD